MAILQSDIAVNYVNQIMNLVQQIRLIRAQAGELATINAANPLGNLIAALNTTALASDGQLGTADTPGTPVESHYIDPRVYPGISRVVKPTDVTAALQIVTDFMTFCAGTSVGVNAGRPAQIDNVSM